MLATNRQPTATGFYAPKEPMVCQTEVRGWMRHQAGSLQGDGGAELHLFLWAFQHQFYCGCLVAGVPRRVCSAFTGCVARYVSSLCIQVNGSLNVCGLLKRLCQWLLRLACNMHYCILEVSPAR